MPEPMMLPTVIAVAAKRPICRFRWPRGLDSGASATGTSGAVAAFDAIDGLPGERWWRRRELNPRPKVDPEEALRA